MGVVLFDGVCNLCNSSVNWIIDHDKKNEFRFASLQSEYGQRMVQQYNISGNYMDTVVLIKNDRAYLRSAAVLQVLKGIGGIYSLALVFNIFPAFIRDVVYNFIAKNRYRWFGKQESCRIPSPELKAKFIDK